MPLLIAFVIVWFIQQELVITLILFVLIGLSFKLSYEKNEWRLLIFGIILGIILEIGSDQILKLQFWSEGMLFGIPLWLPFMWGYGFVLIRRIGNLIVKE